MRCIVHVALDSFADDWDPTERFLVSGGTVRSCCFSIHSCQQNIALFIQMHSASLFSAYLSFDEQVYRQVLLFAVLYSSPLHGFLVWIPGVVFGWVSGVGLWRGFLAWVSGVDFWLGFLR